MAAIRPITGAAIQNVERESPAPLNVFGYSAPELRPGEDSGRYCAYNATRARFVSTEVEGADFSPVILASRMTELTPGSGAAFWLIPYRGLPPTSFRFPIDLVLLSRNLLVLEAIESYPLSLGSDSGQPAVSALAVPAGTINAVGIGRGDQLILSTPEEMKGHLRRLETANAEAAPDPTAAQGGTVAAEDPEIRALGDRVWADDNAGKAVNEISQEQPPVPQEAHVEEELDRAAIADQAGWNKPKPQKSWWQKWKSDEPEDPRRAPREPLPGLTAYFFSGGQPVAHGVRNISATGLYVFTEERWYKGTIIRITLTDRKEQTPERTITINAKVVRWGNDGVGLQFIIKHKKEKLSLAEDISGSTSRELIEQFLQRYRGEPLPN
jgi:hypothetical protein